MNSSTYCGAKRCGGTRRNCQAKVAQIVLGVPGEERRGDRQADQRRRIRGGEANQRRSDGVASKASATPAPKKTAVSFDRRARPRAATASHQAERPVRQTSTSAAKSSAQNRMSGVSGVATIAAPTRGMPTQIRQANAAASTERNSRQAVNAISAGSAATVSASNARTPNSEGPKRAVEARIHAATIGG